MTVGEVIAHELAHAVVPNEFREPGRYDFSERGKEGMWVRRQAGQVAVDLGLPGANNADHLITKIPVNETQGCTREKPRGDGARDGILFLDGSRGYNGVGSTVPPGSGLRDTIDSRRLAHDETDHEVERADSGGLISFSRLSRIPPLERRGTATALESRFGNWDFFPVGVAPSASGNSVESRGISPEGVVASNPTQQAPPQHVSGFTEISSSTRAMQYLGRRDGNTPPASVFDTGVPAAHFVLPDQLNSSGRPIDWAAALAGLGPPNPMQAAPLPQAERTSGISSTGPVRYLSRAIADQPQASLFDTSAPAVPFVPFNEVFSPAPGNAFTSGSDASSLAGGAGGSSMRGPQGSSASTLLEYIRHLNQLDATKPQPSTVDPDASLAPSDSPSPMGGLAGRIAALSGFDPDNPDAPPPGGLLKLLLAAQQR